MKSSADTWRSGRVLSGDQTGRTLGFPTVNFDPELAHDVVEDGVYAAGVLVHETVYRGALYVGPRLTLGETKRVLEIHLLDFSGDLYDAELRFFVGPFIRPPVHFESDAALKKQLAADILAVRRTAI